MKERIFVIKLFSERAARSLMFWLNEHRDSATYAGSRVMTHRDGHLPGDVVLLVKSEIDLHHAAMFGFSPRPWEGSILMLDDFDYLIGHSREVLLEHIPPVSGLQHLKAVVQSVLCPKWAPGVALSDVASSFLKR